MAQQKISQFEHNGITYGKFKCLQRSAFSILLEARALPSDTSVAIKLVPDSSKHNDLHILRHGLKHPNIVALLDDFRTCVESRVTSWYTAMVFEFTAHGTLKTRVKDKKVCAGLALHYVRQVFEGLAYLHAYGIFHLDIKPANILVFSARPDGLVGEQFDQQELWPTAKICDFGLAVFAHEQKHGSRGTINYMCPENDQNAMYTDKCDVWSAACVLYYLACGVAPFERGRSTSKTLDAISKMEYEPYESRRPEGQRIAGIFAACFVPSARRPSAQDVLDKYFCAAS